MSERSPEALKKKLIAFASDFPFYKLIGFEVLDLGPGWSKTRITLRDDLKNPQGVIHGGVTATLIDAGITQAMLMTDQYQQVRDTRGNMSNIDLRVKYLRPLTSGSMTCEAEMHHLGKRVGHARAVVTNDEGKEIAVGDSTVIISLGPGKG